ncbi:MAG: LCP family protein [Acidimicrobiia bacterium]
MIVLHRRGERSVPKKRQLRRTWPQRGVIGLNVMVAMACLSGAWALNYGRGKVESISRIPNVLGHLDPVTPIDRSSQASNKGTAGAGTIGEPSGQTSDAEEIVVPDAENWLLTGTDKRTKANCGIDPKSQYAGAFGDGLGDGRSDTIMVLRIDPKTKFAAILSFPRDLRVKIAGRKSENRINTAYDPDDPGVLIETIKQNFDLPINGFASIGFCGFKDLVDAVGGVKIPFDVYAKDTNTGFAVTPGCVELGGTEALAYARSRHMRSSDDGRSWRDDPGNDWSRVKRQQDLIKRIAQKLSNAGIATNLRMLDDVVDAVFDNVDLPEGVEVSRFVDLARAMRGIDPADIRTFTLEGVDVNRTYIRLLDTETNTNVLKIFRGEAAPATTKTADELTGGPLPDTGDTSTATTLSSDPTTSASPSSVVSDATVPVVVVEEEVLQQEKTVLPADDPTCR